jgi:HK97 family phage major capsid protein
MYEEVTDSGLKAALLERHGKQVALKDRFGTKSVTEYNEAELTEWQTAMKEIDDLSAKLEPALNVYKDAERVKRDLNEWNTSAGNIPNPGGDPSVQKPQDEPRQKSLGELVTDHPAFKAGHKASNPRFSLNIENADMKTLMTTTAGWAPPNNRTANVVLSAQRRPVVADLIPQDNAAPGQAAVKYMEETTATNAAATVAEGGTKAESALALTERTQPNEWIATWIPVTRQQLEYVPQAQAYINNRLTLFLAQTEEIQLLTGTGTTPQLQGFYTKSGIQTAARGADTEPDAIFKMMNKLRGSTGLGFVEPSGIVMDPLDWEQVRLLRTTEGMYIWGNPADAGPERMWGLPVIITAAATENTVLIGDFALFSHITRGLGIQIDVSDSHSTYFVENKLAVRAEESLSLEIYRAAAFGTVTSF